MKKIIVIATLLSLITGCENDTSDRKQQKQQELLLQEGTSQTGMPAIKNFRERKLLKDILELRDQDGLVTYTYIFDELDGKLRFFGETIGYGIPYAAQFSNPQKIEYQYGGYRELPQAEPNGLFTPAAAEGTWILMRDPNNPKGKTLPVYVEPRIIVSPFKLKID